MSRTLSKSKNKIGQRKNKITNKCLLPLYSHGHGLPSAPPSAHRRSSTHHLSMVVLRTPSLNGRRCDSDVLAIFASPLCTWYAVMDGSHKNEAAPVPWIPKQTRAPTREQRWPATTRLRRDSTASHLAGVVATGCRRAAWRSWRHPPCLSHHATNGVCVGGRGR